MFDGLNDSLQKLSWRAWVGGAVVGVVISSLFSPFLVAAATDLYVSTGVYGTPSIGTSFTNTDTTYPVGMNVSDFEGLEWKGDFEVYRLEIQNPSNRVVEDLEVTVPLPGCAAYVNTDGPSVNGDYEVDDIITARLSNGTSDQTEVSKKNCSKEIRAESVDPGETLVVEFVVDDRFERCDLLLGVTDKPNIIVAYRWSVSGQTYIESSSNRETILWQEYSDFTKNNPGKGAFFEERQGHRYGAFIRTNASSMAEGMRQCGAKWT